MANQRRPRPRSPYYKIKASDLDPTPSFQSKKNMLDVVKFNMQTIGRRYYYQRLVLITKHNNTSAPFLKDVFAKPINRSKCTSGDEKMTALFILFDSYTIQMLEGPEEMINAYFNELAPLHGKQIIQSRIVLNYTNINQKFFRRVIWRIAEFPSTLEKVPDSCDDKKFFRCLMLTQKMYELCKKVREEEMDDSGGFKSSYLSADYKRITPDMASLDAILGMDELQTIRDYNEVITSMPSFYGFSETVWPISHDFMPNTIFDWEEFDINLNFFKKSCA